MQDDIGNPYEPPATSDLVMNESIADAHFFTTSTFKLAVMSLCTLGIYKLYWFYKNWVLIKERTGQSIMPFWRAFFAPLWAYSCFKQIKTSANENNVRESLSIGWLATGYFFLQASWRLPDPYWLVSYISFAFIIPCNRVALDINKQRVTDFKNNDSFSGWNWVGIIFGGMILLLGLAGTFMPEM